MFIQLNVKNWRSIEEASLQLAPFTVVVGRNSAGKSNLVDALVFADEVSRDASTAVSRRGGIESIRRWSHSKPFDVTIELKVAKSEPQLQTDFFRHSLVLRSGKNGAWSFLREEIEVRAGSAKRAFATRRNRDFTIEVHEQGGPVISDGEVQDTTSLMVLARQFGAFRGPSKVRPPTVQRLRPVPELMRVPQPPADSRRLTESAENVATALRQLNAAGMHSVIGAMKRIVPGLVNVVARSVGRYVTLDFTQLQENDRTPEFAATEMSDGALRALAVIVAAHQMPAGGILIIEEPEGNLHPGAAGVIYDVLHSASQKGAVLITTHSPEVLDRAREDEILVCEYEDGVTKIGELDQGQRQLVRDGLFTIAEIMRSDELRREGARPRSVPD